MCGLQCLSAFVRFGTCHRSDDRKGYYRVSNAFRHSSVSGQDVYGGVFTGMVGLQCLSAFVRFGTWRCVCDESQSPVVSNAFRHSSVSGLKDNFNISYGVVNLQCLSAFVRFGTSAGVRRLCMRAATSPMPFGIRPFRDCQGEPDGSPSQRVSNAFRHSSVSGPAWERRGQAGPASSPMPFGIRPFRDREHLT